MPMLTMCPERPDLNSLFFNLLDSNPEWISDEAFTATKKAIFYQMVPKTPDSYRDAKHFFDQCKADTETGPRAGQSSLVGEEECQFVLMLQELSQHFNSIFQVVRLSYLYLPLQYEDSGSLARPLSLAKSFIYAVFTLQGKRCYAGLFVRHLQKGNSAHARLLQKIFLEEGHSHT